jgi:hypothetical protein
MTKAFRQALQKRHHHYAMSNCSNTPNVVCRKNCKTPAFKAERFIEQSAAEKYFDRINRILFNILKKARGA